MEYVFSRKDPDMAAKLIKIAAAARGVKHSKIADYIGVRKDVFSAFVNRRLNLLPEQIDKAFELLEVKDLVVELSAPVEFVK
jgi:hypothetical protein